MSTISSGQGDTESNASKNNQDDREMTSGLKMKITKKDSRSAFELRDTEDRSPYTLLQFLKNILQQNGCSDDPKRPPFTFCH